MGYEDTRQKILSTLMQRPNGKEIQPSEHQDFALSLLEYIRNVELISGSTLIGVADEDTVPVQSDVANGTYIAGVAQQRNITYQHFIDQNGEPISVSTGEMEAKLVILTWNREYWEKQEISANIISQANEAFFFYTLTIRKTYESYADMRADVTSPIGNNGKSIKQGEIVSIHNESNERENSVYSYEFDSNNNPYWQLQTRLDKLDSRTLDGGRADTQYGGAITIDCGKAN